MVHDPGSMTETKAPVPDSVRDTIAARLDTLTMKQKAVLQSAAVVGGTFGADALGAVGSDNADDVERVLSELCLRGFLRRPSAIDGQEHGEYAFHHALVHDACYDQIPRDERAEGHARTADWLIDVDAAEGLIGHHLARAYQDQVTSQTPDSEVAGLALRAVSYLLVDSERALRCGDGSSAVRLSERIARLLRSCAPGVTSTELHLVEEGAKLLVTLARWQDAADLLSAYADAARAAISRDLGVALCQLARSRPRSVEYRRGQRLLTYAAAQPHRDIDAIASLAGTWKGVDDQRAQDLYYQCLDIDADNPYALGNVLEYEVLNAGSWSAVKTRHNQIAAAYERCRTQVETGENIPWAAFDAGKFALLLDRTTETLTWYAYALRLTPAEHMMVTTMRSLSRLAVATASPDLESVRTLLAVARAARYPSEASLATLPGSTPLPISAPGANVLILAGGTDSAADHWSLDHETMLVEAFSAFHGMVISGGTTAGIPRLVGTLRTRFGPEAARYRVPAGQTSRRCPFRLALRRPPARRLRRLSFSIVESLPGLG